MYVNIYYFNSRILLTLKIIKLWRTIFLQQYN